MEIKRLKDKYIVRIEPGEKLVASLEKFARDTQIGFAWVNIIGGGFKNAEYSFSVGFNVGYDPKKKTEGPLELLSAEGCIAWNHKNPAEPAVHLHANFIDNKLEKAFGGHLHEVESVGLTAEVLITPLSEEKITRKLDEGVNVPLLNLPAYNSSSIEKFKFNHGLLSVSGIKDQSNWPTFVSIAAIVLSLVAIFFSVVNKRK